MLSCSLIYLTFNFKSKMAHDVFENKNECQLTSTSSFKMSPYKSHYMSNVKNLQKCCQNYTLVGMCLQAATSRMRGFKVLCVAPGISNWIGCLTTNGLG